jgi:hypothetical protein
VEGAARAAVARAAAADPTPAAGARQRTLGREHRPGDGGAHVVRLKQRRRVLQAGAHEQRQGPARVRRGEVVEGVVPAVQAPPGTGGCRRRSSHGRRAQRK